MSLLSERVEPLAEASAAATEPVVSIPRRNRVLSWLATWWVLLPLAIFVGWASAPFAFSTADPITGVPVDKLLSPNVAHPFGTDHLGRDVYARVVYGTRQTLLTAGLAC